MWSSRLVIVVLALLGTVAFYQLAARIFDRNTAQLMLLLYATTPFIIQWGWYTMSELPALSLAYCAACVLFAVIAVQQIISIYQQTPNYATGYESAARLTLQYSHSPMVFFDGVNNGYFIYFMRALDPERRHFVLRGDKLLSSSSVFSSSEQIVHAHTIDDIKKIISSLGVELIVVESRNEMGIAIHSLLRDYLQRGPFQLLYDIPVSSTRPSSSNQHLLIYRFLDAQPITRKVLQLQLPIVGKTLNVPITRP